MQVKLPKLGLIVYSIAAACSSQFYGTHFNFTCVFHFTYRKGFDRHREWVYHKTTTTKAKIDIYSETSQLTLYCFTYNWHNTFTINVSSLITFKFFYVLWIHSTQKMLKISFIRIDSRMDTSYRGLSHSFKGTEQFAKGLTERKIVMMKCLFIFNWIWIHCGIWLSSHTKIWRSGVERNWGLYL